MKITEERLQELETLGREAEPFKAEFAALCDAYRSRTPGLTITRGKDGVWLNFKALSGKVASIHLEAIKEGRGPLVKKALIEWSADHFQGKS